MVGFEILEVLQPFLTDNNGNGTWHYADETIKTGKRKTVGRNYFNDCRKIFSEIWNKV